MERSCIICNAPFNAKRSDAVVCSQKCRQKHWRNKLAQTSSPAPDDVYEELLKANEKIAEQEKQLQESLLLYNNQTATIVKLQAENERFQRQVYSLSEELEKSRKQALGTSVSSPSGVITVGQKINDWKGKIIETTWAGDLQKVMTDIKNSDLPDWGKKQLQSIADQHRTTFY